MIQVVIMAGGIGTRFWPLSRKRLAKQFLHIIDHKSLLEHTLDRLSGFVENQNIWVVGNHDQSKHLKPLLQSIPEDQVLLEPMGKNTAPCIGWAATELLKKDPDATMVVLPADHFIKDIDSFQNTLRQAVEHVGTSHDLLTIGIQPTHPHTGYGYIEAQDTQSPLSSVKRFREKPGLEQAELFLKTGGFYWNSGIFVWRADTILDLIKTYLPHNHSVLQSINSLKHDSDYQNNLAACFEQFQNISIDYGIMEHAVEQTVVLKAGFDWSDVGNWNALDSFWEKDNQQNAVKGHYLGLNSNNNIIYSSKRLVSTINVSNFIIIDSEDALLILPKSSDQEIRKLYEKLPDSHT
ncbi:MAG: NTP transferase domain-containing protein [Candidatus Margulisbacteria bacterium]|nr:NTP transferase domain-containing protein [Candidatus Margulisiibacteriota bacterium]